MGGWELGRVLERRKIGRLRRVVEDHEVEGYREMVLQDCSGL